MESVSLVCRSLESILDSLSQVLGMTINELSVLLKTEHNLISEQKGLHGGVTYKEYLYQKVVMENKLQIAPIKYVHWFHGSRVINPTDFKTHGILPLPVIFPSLCKTIDEIACQYGHMPSEGDEHHTWLMSSKLSRPCEWGPDASLVREAHLCPHHFSGFHDYCDMPEIIEDYARATYENTSEDILNRYRQMTKKCIVEFVAEPDRDVECYVMPMLNYAYHATHSDPHSDADNTCYGGCGTPIPPQRIVNIEVL